MARFDAPTQWDTNRVAQLKSGQLKGAFAGPNSTFPIASPEDVSMAWRLSEKVEYREDLRKNIVSIAAKHGWLGGLPQDELSRIKQDSVSMTSAAKQRKQDAIEKLVKAETVEATDIDLPKIESLVKQPVVDVPEATPNSYINAYAEMRKRLDARLQCGPGAKQCGDRCIPQEYRCRMEEGQKLSNLGVGLGAVGTLAEIRGSALKDLSKLGLGGGDYKTWSGMGRILRIAGATAALQGDLTQASELMKEGKGVSAGLKALTAGLNAAEGARQVGRFGTQTTSISEGAMQGVTGALRSPFEMGKKARRGVSSVKNSAEQVGGGVAQALMGDIPADVKPMSREEWKRVAQGTYTAPKKQNSGTIGNSNIPADPEEFKRQLKDKNKSWTI